MKMDVQTIKIFLLFLKEMSRKSEKIKGTNKQAVCLGRKFSGPSTKFTKKKKVALRRITIMNIKDFFDRKKENIFGIYFQVRAINRINNNSSNLLLVINDKFSGII